MSPRGRDHKMVVQIITITHDFKTSLNDPSRANWCDGIEGSNLRESKTLADKGVDNVSEYEEVGDQSLEVVQRPAVLIEFMGTSTPYSRIVLHEEN